MGDNSQDLPNQSFYTSTINWVSNHPIIMLGLIIVLIIVIIYMFLRTNGWIGENKTPKKIKKKKESDSEDEIDSEIDEVIDAINEKQSD